MINKTNKKGFTLVELLIVIAILAILAVGLVIAINPGEMLAQARDAQRKRHLATLRDSITMVLSKAPLATPAVAPAFVSCAARHTLTTNPAANHHFATPAAWTALTAADISRITGAGWIGLNFNLAGTSFPSPISSLPIDPRNAGDFYYSFICNSTNLGFEINARLESTRHRGLMMNDGGDDHNCTTFLEQTCFYEVGTNLGL